MPNLPLVPADYPGEEEWQAWLAVDHLFSKRTLVAKHPTTTRAVFIDGFRAATESRDQRIRELGPYVQHNDKCRSLDYEVPCDCGLSSILAGQK